MKTSIFFCLFVGYIAWAGQASNHKASAEYSHSDVVLGSMEPFEDTGNVQDKMQGLPDLVAQEDFLKSIGFSGDWPTPEEVYKRVDNLEKDQGEVKVRGLANVPMKEMAKDYEEVYRGPWANPDPHVKPGREPAADRHRTSADLHWDTTFAPSAKAEVNGAPEGGSSRAKSQ